MHRSTLVVLAVSLGLVGGAAFAQRGDDRGPLERADGLEREGRAALERGQRVEGARAIAEAWRMRAEAWQRDDRGRDDRRREDRGRADDATAGRTADLARREARVEQRRAEVHELGSALEELAAAGLKPPHPKAAAMAKRLESARANLEEEMAGLHQAREERERLLDEVRTSSGREREARADDSPSQRRAADPERAEIERMLDDRRAQLADGEQLVEVIRREVRRAEERGMEEAAAKGRERLADLDEKMGVLRREARQAEERLAASPRTVEIEERIETTARGDGDSRERSEIERLRADLMRMLERLERLEGERRRVRR